MTCYIYIALEISSPTKMTHYFRMCHFYAYSKLHLHKCNVRTRSTKLTSVCINGYCVTLCEYNGYHSVTTTIILHQINLYDFSIMKGVLIFYIIQKHDLSYQNFKKKKTPYMRIPCREKATAH